MSKAALEIEELVFQIMRLMKRQMDVTTEFSSLNISQIQTLVFLKENDGANMTDLATFLQIELPSVTSLVNKLVRKDLVQRLADRSDRRVVRIELTKTGEKLLLQTTQKRIQQIKKVMSYLSNDQKREFITILKTIREHLEN